MKHNQLIFGHDVALAQWVFDRLPDVERYPFDTATAIGVARGERLIAAVVYHDYQPEHENIQLSMAADSPMWADRGTIRALLHYPFRQLGCFMVYTLTPPENEMALRVNRHIGLAKKTIIPHARGRGRHDVLCQMTEPEYRRTFEHGKEVQSLAASSA